ncbi:hypothetical protein H8356DRAFT_1396967 [Neocallimastix lanati (nom. inval.)]|nr:hypothetical protein H8356DRAFT_1396967 [Neocallimastix sp. JGI-2020a]
MHEKHKKKDFRLVLSFVRFLTYLSYIYTNGINLYFEKCQFKHNKYNNYFYTGDYTQTLNENNVNDTFTKEVISKCDCNYNNFNFTIKFINIARMKFDIDISNNWFIINYPNPDSIHIIYQSNYPNNSCFQRNKEEFIRDEYSNKLVPCINQKFDEYDNDIENLFSISSSYNNKGKICARLNNTKCLDVQLILSSAELNIDLAQTLRLSPEKGELCIFGFPCCSSVYFEVVVIDDNGNKWQLVKYRQGSIRFLGPYQEQGEYIWTYQNIQLFLDAICKCLLVINSQNARKTEYSKDYEQINHYIHFKIVETSI